MEALRRELSLAFRSLRKNPTLTGVVVLTLALGIGANSAIFSVVDAVLLEPLAFREPDRLVKVWPGGSLPRQGLAWLEADNSVYSGVGGYSFGQRVTLRGDEEPLRLDAVKVSTGFFRVLGVEPAAGRLLLSGDEAAGGPAVAVVSYGLWQRRFGGDRALIGRSIELDGRVVTVVGVAPRGFAFPERTVDLWEPVALTGGDPGTAWGGPASMQVVARLSDGVSLARAQEHLESFLPRVRAGYPWPMPESYGSSAVVAELRADMLGDLQKRLGVLLGAVGLVLLIACANIANLLLVKARGRSKEIALRSALGATREQLGRQLLAESVALGCLGGLVGIGVGYLGLAALRPLLPADLPRVDAIAIDGSVLLFTLALSLLTSLLFGLLPAFKASRPDLQGVLKEGGRAAGGAGQRRLSSALVCFEVALAVVVACGAALLLQTFWNLSRHQLGFEPTNAYIANLAPSTTRFPDAASQRAFYQEVMDRLASSSAATGASISNLVPFSGSPFGSAFLIEGRPEPEGADWPFAQAHVVVSPSYFRTLGLPVLRGRAFEAGDRADAPKVVLISQALADRYWSGQDPVGTRLGFPGRQTTWMTIVGIVGDARYDGSAQPPIALYQPIEQARVGPMWLLARSSLPTQAFAARVREVVRGLDRDTPISQLQSLSGAVSETLGRPRFSAVLLGAFALLALVLGLVGVFGVTENTVRQRAREVAIRMSLGAERRSVVWEVLRHIAVLVVVGVALGVLASFLAGELLSGLLFGVESRIGLTLAGVAVLLCGVALGAGLWPVLRGTRIAPASVLRAE
jgi:putative ABC transport system permease protein